jgi:outer membrane protein OmpA-like peptidoglycan-associated protein
VTKSKLTRNVKKGKWNEYDSAGRLLKESNFIVNKQIKRSQKDGDQVFYDPLSGQPIIVQTYRKGRIVHQLGMSPAIFIDKGVIYHIFKDFETFTVAEYFPKKEGRKDFMMTWKSSFEDPNGLMHDSLYMAFEDSLGDPGLMEVASFDTKSQYNHITNPEFEIHPKAFYSIPSFTDQLPGWFMASKSPDFFLSGDQARSGGGFVGFRVFSMTKHIEYIQNRLKAPLKKDSLYCFSAYVKLSPGSRFATNAFGFLLTDKPHLINTDELLTIKPSKNLETQVLLFKTRWMKVQCTYKAKGGETWLVLGSFQNHRDLTLKGLPGPNQESYYYMDDVSLVPIDSDEECDCNFADQRINEVDTIRKELKDDSTFDGLKVGDKLVLDDVNFENDKSDLLPESFKTLYEVLVYLKENSSVRVEISGHTSSLGGYEHNVGLSQERARSVKGFLTLNGIAEERISTAGYGPKYPIADDATERGQMENRRVEFKLLQQ